AFHIFMVCQFVRQLPYSSRFYVGRDKTADHGPRNVQKLDLIETTRPNLQSYRIVCAPVRSIFFSRYDDCWLDEPASAPRHRVPHRGKPCPPRTDRRTSNAI